MLKTAILEMERSSYKGGCAVSERTRIEMFKRRAGLDKQLWLIINKMLFKIVMPLRT